MTSSHARPWPQPTTAPGHVPDAAVPLLDDLRRRGGLAFAAYQPAGLLRQIRRRMERVRVVDFSAYRELLAADPEEHRRLCAAVLVHHTAFFRDPEDWAHLAAAVLPGLLAGKATGEPILAWSAGCATGEEAYTLAIALAEAAGPDALARRRVRVIATDVSEAAIAATRAGRYAAGRVALVPPELLRKYFRADGDGWVARPELRGCLVSCRHDLLRQAPFHGLDLIACRNTLLYFTPGARAAALARLYVGLGDGGVLFAGRAESPQPWSGLFRAEWPRQPVFRRADDRMGEALALLRRPPAGEAEPIGGPGRPGVGVETRPVPA